MPSLGLLTAGQRFRYGPLGLVGTLLMVNECRARVRLDSAVQDEVSFVDGEGEARTFRTRRSQETDWDPATVVDLVTQEERTMQVRDFNSPELAGAAPTTEAAANAGITEASQGMLDPKTRTAKPGKGSKPAKASKAAPAAKPAKAKAEGNGKAAKAKVERKPAPEVKEITPEERESAKKAGVTVPQLRVLQALAKSSTEMSYRDIEAKTGYYSPLTAMMRSTAARSGGIHESSLEALGLVTEAKYETGPLVFKITAKGRKAVEKAAK